MRILYLLIFTFIIPFACQTEKEEILFNDDFSETKIGPYSVPVGAHTEYHYLHEAAPRGKWEISTFRYNLESMLVWSVQADENGNHMMVSNHINTQWTHAHPMLCAGDRFWGNYEMQVQLSLPSDEQISGIIARYQNDRSYYAFILHEGKAQIKYVHQATAFREPYEEILAEKEYQLRFDAPFLMRFSAVDDKLTATVGDVTIQATDDRFQHGKIALMSDGPVKYHSVSVTAKEADVKAYFQRKSSYDKDVEEAGKNIPAMRVWKKISTLDFGVGRNLRFGDLDSDGDLDVLVTQVKRHGMRDSNSEVGCMTALTFDGEILWQLGQPDRDNADLSNDVGVQIHDINNDGKNEVIYCKDLEIVVAEGSTGQTLYKSPTPKVTDPEPNSRYNIFDRILGDCLYFLDLDGKGYKSNIMIKDRYHRVWALNDKLEILWYKYLNAGHYPYAFDIDKDGKDELAIGYSLLDDDGSTIWTLDDGLQDHADGVAIVDYLPGQEPIFMNAASDEGMFFADLKGNIIKHHYLGHVQNPAVANFRDDLPGLETVTVNFWGNQGIINFFDATGNVYKTIEPNQYGSMCLPVNWTGKSEEFFVLNANVYEGGIYDGWGRKVLDFPGDGHPDMCNAVLDITGDCRDEIVVWDPYSIWVYTQKDNEIGGRLYKPERNPLFNYSNYQATVSYPGWREE